MPEVAGGVVLPGGRRSVGPARGRAVHGTDPEARLTVEVRPQARRAGIEVVRPGIVRVAVRAAPVDGAANEAMRAALAGALGCPRAAVAIVRGQTARTKLVRVRGLSADEVNARLRT